MKRSHFIAGLLVWPLATAAGGWLFLSTGPLIEARLLPVLLSQSIDQVARKGTRVCWEWHYFKQRDARPINVAWAFQVNGQAVRTAIVTTDSGAQSYPVVRELRQRPPGIGESGLCTLIPDDFAEVRRITIAGAVNYQTSHDFWTIWQSIPVVVVPDPDA